MNKTRETSILCDSGDICTDTWKGGVPQVITGRWRVHQGLRLDGRVVVDEDLHFTWTSVRMGTHFSQVSVNESSDLSLNAVYADRWSLWPLHGYAPASGPEPVGEEEIGRTLSAVLRRIDWSRVTGGVDLAVSLTVSRAVLERAVPPADFRPADLCAARVTSNVTIFGELVDVWMPSWLLPEAAIGHVPCRRCQECGHLTSLPFTHKILEPCLDGGEHKFKEFPDGESEDDLARAGELLSRPRRPKGSP